MLEPIQWSARHVNTVRLHTTVRGTVRSVRTSCPMSQLSPNTMRQPFQMSTATQTFQPQATIPPVTVQTNQATTTNSVVCSRCGRYHDNNSCPGSVALSYRCGLTASLDVAILCCHNRGVGPSYAVKTSKTLQLHIFRLLPFIPIFLVP